MFRIRLRELREAKGYKSQQSFADAFGVAQSTVGNWEAGKRQPNYETTIRLAQFFEVTVDYLIGNNKPDMHSTLFREGLANALENMRNVLAGDEGYIEDYYELYALAESSYPLSLADACIAADKIGETVSSLLGEDERSNAAVEETKKSPSAENSEPGDDLNCQIMNLVREMNASQKSLLFALLNTTLGQTHRMPISDQASIDEATLRLKSQDPA